MNSDEGNQNTNRILPYKPKRSLGEEEPLDRLNPSLPNPWLPDSRLPNPKQEIKWW